MADLSTAEILALIDKAAIDDPTIAAYAQSRENDIAIAKAISTGRVRPRGYLITRRGLRRVLGAHEGRIFLQALRAAAALITTLPESHPAFDDLWWLNELLPDLDSNGIDVGDQQTRDALRGLVQVCAAVPITPAVTEAHCAALEAASNDPDDVTAPQVSDALNARARGEA